MNKLIILICLIVLEGCTSKIALRIHNNSGVLLTYIGDSEIELPSGETTEVVVFTSTRSIQLRSPKMDLEYVLVMAEIPGKYFEKGLFYSANVRIEPNLQLYIREPNINWSQDSHLIEQQPGGFPISPKQVELP